MRTRVAFYAILLPGASLANCPEPLDALVWSAPLTNAERAYADLDSDRFLTAMGRADLTLPCLAATLPPPLAGRFHRLRGVRAYTVGNEDAARRSFAGANAVDPTGRLPADLAPEAHEVWVFAAAPAASDAGKTLDRPPRPMQLYFDGVATRHRPVERPTVFQLFDGEAVTQTLVLDVGDPMPLYPIAPGPRRVRTGLLAGAAASAGASVVLYAVASSQAKEFHANPPPDGWTRDDAIDARRGVNTLVIAAGVTLIGAGGLAAGAAAW